MNLKLLFTRDGIQYQLQKGRIVQEENSCFINEDSKPEETLDFLKNVLDKNNFESIQVISALNKFSVAPSSFDKHELGKMLISYNSQINDDEEVMLSVNKKYGIQFYFALPKSYYNLLKNKSLPINFNFSGEKFLNSITSKNGKEIHINLYYNQCEFFALDERKVILYNNLDVNSEVDFLYFIMFTISKLGFSIDQTSFYVYGETTENETFISELRKFVHNIKIVFDNYPKNIFILN